MLDVLKKKYRQFVKKTQLKKEPDTVDIRISSLPEWLYKITLKDPQELHDKVDTYIERLKKKAHELKSVNTKLSIIKIEDINISPYKKELIKTKKESYVIKINGLTEGLITIDGSMETKRRTLEKIDEELHTLAQKRSFYEKPLKPYFSNQLDEIKQISSELQKELQGFEKMFTSENDEKVKATIDLIKKIQENIEEEKIVQKKIIAIQDDIDSNKQSIYKLRNKLNTLKENARFRDALLERQDLFELEENKKRKISLLQKHLDEATKKMPQTPLVKEYMEFTEDALIDDHNLDFLQVLQETDSPESEWFSKNLENNRTEIVKINEKITTLRKMLKKHMIIAEIDDIENRITYFRQKLEKLYDEKREEQEVIQGLDIHGLKNKLYKELLILTGYDVNIIYNE